MDSLQRRGSCAADPRAWEPALLQNRDLLQREARTPAKGKQEVKQMRLPIV